MTHTTRTQRRTPWLRTHTDLGGHRKTIELADRLDIKPVQAVGHLVTFWHNVLIHQEDGDLTGCRPRHVTQWAAWDGDPDLFLESMVASGWIDRDDDKITVHDWIDYAGPLLRERNKKREQRLSRDCPGTVPGPGGDKAGTCPGRVRTLEYRVRERQRVDPPHSTIPSVQNPPPKPPSAEKSGSGASRSGSSGVGWKCLNRMTVPDLEDDDRLERRRAAAVRAGLWDDSEAARFAWFALAERALRLGDSPPAMFRRLVQDRPDCIDQQDEDRASIRLNGRGPPQKRKQDQDRHNPAL